MQLFRQWPIYFAGRMLPAAISFFGVALYTRALDPASFGTYALLLSTSFLIGLFGYSWLRVATLRTMTTVPPGDEPDFAATIALSFLGTSVIVALATLVVLRIASPGLPLVSELLTAAAAIASGWFELNITLVQARMRLVTYGLLQAFRSAGALIASLLLISTGAKANALLGGFAIGNCAALGALGLWRPMLRGRFRTDVLIQLFRLGWPSSAAALTNFSTTFQRFFLSAVGGTAAVGVFAAASDFSQQTVGLLMGTALIAGQPLAFRARDLGSQNELSDQLRNNARLVYTVGLGACAGLVALSGPITHLYFGARFQTNAATLLAISAIAIFFMGLRANYFEQIFEIARDTRPMAIIAAFRTIVTIGLSLVFIHLWAAVGAAWATLVSEFLGLVLSIIWARRLMDVPVPLTSFAKIGAATAAMMCAMAVIPSRYGMEGFVLTVIAGVLTYAAALAVMHAGKVRSLVALRISRAG